MMMNMMSKWYSHKPESDLEKETYKILRDYQIQTNHQIAARRPDLALVSKKERTQETTEKNYENKNASMLSPPKTSKKRL